MASAPIPSPDDMPHRRAAPRLRVSLPCKLILLGGEYDGALEDISLTGARVSCNATMQVGQSGILQCSPLEVLFSIVRVERQSAGLHFEEQVGVGTIRTLRWHNDRYCQDEDAQIQQTMEDWLSGKLR